MTLEEEAFATALARAFVSDIEAHPPRGALARVVVRWFTWDDPLYFTLHAFGEHDEAAAGNEWYPLTWSNVDAELQRADRVREDPEVQRTGEALQAAYEDDEDLAEEPVGSPSPPVLDVVRRLPTALEALPRMPHFAAAAAHFEGYGPEYVLRTVASPELKAQLAARDEFPRTDPF